MSASDVPLADVELAIVDGALATELEARGCDLNHALWSARVLLESPETIEAVHRSYLDAGADVLVTAGYQASLEGFRALGLSDARAEDLMRESFRVADRARTAHAAATDLSAWIAASIGPYGAFLADGSEYTGNYAATRAVIEAFHAPRVAISADEARKAERAFLAFETIPSLDEALVLADLLERERDTAAWLTFSCRDDSHTCEGQRIEECVDALERYGRFFAIGVNCTDPVHVEGLVRRIAARTSKRIVVYPNSGERYDATSKRWYGDTTSFERSVDAWIRAGASIVGGCCRTTPATIATLAARYRS